MNRVLVFTRITPEVGHQSIQDETTRPPACDVADSRDPRHATAVRRRAERLPPAAMVDAALEAIDTALNSVAAGAWSFGRPGEPESKPKSPAG
jgi:hypothetical protein